MSHPRSVQDLSTGASGTEALACLRGLGPEVNPDAPEMGAYKK